MTGEFEGDVAVVTGGTRGIGRAVAEELAARGARTVATYHADEEAAEETRVALAEYDPDTEVVQFDVGDAEATAAAFEAITERHGQVSVLVNNAGVMANGLVARMDPGEWGRVIETNLTGAFNCTHHAARGMLRRGGGRIVNVSSIAALRGWPGQANYAASKAGLVGFTRSVARELGGKDVRVNAVCPGYTDTDLYDELAGAADEDLLEQIPAGRLANPEEVAAAVCFLASPAASYVNGAVLRVDGGLLA